MSCPNFIRLKIQIDSTDVEFTKDLDICFLYYLDISQIGTIEAFKRDLVKKIFFIKNARNRQQKPCENYKFSGIMLSVEDFELPRTEPTRLLRDSDVVM